MVAIEWRKSWNLIFFLIGFENRLLVLIEWAWSYVSYERGARLITGGWHGGTPHTD